MKKIFLVALLCAGLGIAESYAQKTIKTTYYGEKANESYENPCKGKCVRVCAIKETSFTGGGGAIDDPYTPAPFSVGEENTTVKTVIKDAEGNVIRECVEVYPGDMETAKREYILEAIKNGGVVE